MTGLHTLLGRATRRSCVAMMAVAVVALAPLAPMASATPEGDADAAITQAWEADGGDAGSLGPKEGDVYSVGGGFGQDFAGGKIYFTPDTGAHIMQGAILDKYLALGGPADGDLGFPDIDEGPGKATDSRNTTFSAADNPVIFWTPDTGAQVVRGAINAAWDELGGSAGPLGVPTEDEVYRGDVVSQNFTGGELSWDGNTKTFTSTPPELADQLDGLEIPGDATSQINAARRAAGGPLGPLGAPEGPPTPVAGDGLVQTFAGGKIFYSPATGAGVITGRVLAKYESVGGPTGDLGFPTGNESDGGLAPASRIATFAAEDRPVIFWTPDFGAMIVRGAMNAAWSKLGGATGELGPPTADQTQNGDVVTQTFANGAISWDRATNQFTTEPANLASELSGLEVPGRDAPQAPAAAESSGSGGQKWYQQWWWALAVLPVLLLVGAVVTAVILNRRRGEDRAPLDGFDDFDESRDDHDFDSGPLLSHPGSAGQQAHLPLSAWAVSSEDDGDEAVAGGPDRSVEGSADRGFAEDEDAIDTAPTRIPTDVDQIAEPLLAAGLLDGYTEGREGAEGTADDDEYDVEHQAEHDVVVADHREAEAEAELDLDLDPEPASGRHAAIHLDEPAPSQTSLRLALENPYRAPDGYPIKADTKTGLYWPPGSEEYDSVRAEVWFASEEFALTNGFVRG